MILNFSKEFLDKEQFQEHLNWNSSIRSKLLYNIWCVNTCICCFVCPFLFHSEKYTILRGLFSFYFYLIAQFCFELQVVVLFFLWQIELAKRKSVGNYFFCVCFMYTAPGVVGLSPAIDSQSVDHFGYVSVRLRDSGILKSNSLPVKGIH